MDSNAENVLINLCNGSVVTQAYKTRLHFNQLKAPQNKRHFVANGYLNLILVPRPIFRGRVNDRHCHLYLIWSQIGKVW